MKDIKIDLTSKLRADLGARVKMFDNDWADQLDAELVKQFHEKTYAKIKTMADTSMNVLRRIVRDICSVYKEPAERKIKDASDQEQETADELFRRIKLDQTMSVAHRYSKAATASFVMVRPVGEGEEKRVVLRVLTPEQVYVETDPEDPTIMSLFAYSTEIVTSKGETQWIWIVYTKDELWFCDVTGKAMAIDPRTGQVYDTTNTFGIIPAVCFPAEFQIRSFWSPNWNKDAAEANLKIGLFYTYMNYLVKTQSFKQITISADNVDEQLKDQILDPLFPLKLSGGASATTLDLNTRLEAVDQVIRGRIEAICNNYGISKENFALTPQAASGFSLKISNQSLQDIREGDVPLCAHVEQELYKIIARISEILPEGRELQFNPGEVTWPEEWTTEQARWDFEFTNGCSTPVDYLMSLDPQLTRDDAMKILLDKQAEIKLLKPKVSSWGPILGDLASRQAPALGSPPVAGEKPSMSLSATAPVLPTKPEAQDVKAIPEAAPVA